MSPLGARAEGALRLHTELSLSRRLRGVRDTRELLRFLLVHDYERPKENQIARIAAWVDVGVPKDPSDTLLDRGHRDHRLDEAVLPTWEHARKYLQEHTRLTSARIDALKAEYDKLRSKKSARYEDHPAPLDRKVNG